MVALAARQRENTIEPAGAARRHCRPERQPARLYRRRGFHHRRPDRDRGCQRRCRQHLQRARPLRCHRPAVDCEESPARWPVRLGRPQGVARRGATGARARSQGHRFRQGEPRFYPKRELLSHVLGYVGLDNAGLGGLESSYDVRSAASRPAALIQRDAKRRALTSQVEREATAGLALELTIDQYLQNIAERELQAGVEEYGAAGGSIVVMDPATGEILALANAPTFNPNAYSRCPRAIAATAPSRISTSRDRRSRLSPPPRRSKKDSSPPTISST